MFLAMRYHYIPRRNYQTHGEIYICDHPLYNRCTLYKIGHKGLAVVQQRFDPNTKMTYWTEIDSWLVDDIYEQDGFIKYFYGVAQTDSNGLYPTVPVRKLMWALRMKPVKKERWETTFDRKYL